MSDLRVGNPSVEGIADPQAQQVLRYILDVLAVRQGATGDGENAFITRKELRDTGVSIPRLGDTHLQAGTTPDAGTVRDRLEALLGTNIQAIQDAIAASPSFQLLGTPVAGIGAGAQIADVRRAMNNSFASFAQLSQTLQAQIGEQRVLIYQNSEATADLDGKASAQWYVKIDNGGQVAGIGLFSTKNNDTTLSEFYVRADRFAIGSPGVTRVKNPDGSYQAAAQAELPFVVFTTPTNVDGKTVQPGVYMRRTFIHDAAITNAMIANAAVNTLEIAGNAVTVPVSAAQVGTITLSNSWQTVVSATIVYAPGTTPTATVINVNGYVSAVAGTTYYSLLGQILVNGVVVYSAGLSIKGQEMGVAFPMQTVQALSAGTYVVEMQVSDNIGGTHPGFTGSTMQIIGAKR